MNAITMTADITALAEAVAEATPGPVLGKISETIFAGHAVIDRAGLAYALAINKLATEKRNSIPVLSNIKIFHGGDNVASLVTTDLDMEIRIDLPAAIDAGFGVTMPTHMLDAFLKKAPKSDMVAVQSRGEHKERRKSYHDGETGRGPDGCIIDAVSSGAATLDFERVRYDVNTIPVEDFPAHLADHEFSHSFTMACPSFRDIIGSVRPAVSTEETRYYLNGVFMHVVGDKLIFVATDGHRLFKQEIDAPEGATPGLGGCNSSDHMPGAIVPLGIIDIAMKLFKGKACPSRVTINVSATRCQMKFDSVTITSKLIDGTFPDYNRVIPMHNDKLARFEAAAMSEGLEAVTVISTERGRAVKMSIDATGAKLIVVNPDQGRAVCDVACDFTSTNGQDEAFIEIGFNAIYMNELLDTAGGGVIRGEFGDAGSPTVFKADGRAGWLAVLMPMRV